MAFALELWFEPSRILLLEVVIGVEEFGRQSYRDTYRHGITRIVGMVNAQARRVVVLRAKAAAHSWLRHLDFKALGAKNLRQRIRIGRDTEPTALTLECWTIRQVRVGTSRLTHVIPVELDLRDILDVLAIAPFLVSCSVSHCIQPRASQIPSTCVHHSNLQAPDIRACASASLFILGSMYLPRLESFRIHEVIGIYLVEQFLELLHLSSNPPLRVLHFEEVRLLAGSSKRVLREL